MGESSIKLNLGGGLRKIPGYQNIDRKLGTEVYPLREWADNSIDEIRASHILEHFPYREIGPCSRIGCALSNRADCSAWPCLILTISSRRTAMDIGMIRSFRAICSAGR